MPRRILLTGLVGPLGTTALAGYGMGARLEYLQIPLVFGFGSALVTMVGTNIGGGRRARAERIAWTGAGMAAALTGVIGLGAALVPQAWLGLFSADPEVLQAGATYLRIVGPAYGFFGLGLALYFASQGAGRFLWARPGRVQSARHRESGRMDGDPLVRRRTDRALRHDGPGLRGVRAHRDGGREIRRVASGDAASRGASPSRRVAVRGSGRVGGYSGAPLANVGEDVFVARGTPGEAMRRRGLTLRTAAGESTVPVTAVPDTRSVLAPAVGGAVGNAITPLANLTRLVIAAGGDVS